MADPVGVRLEPEVRERLESAGRSLDRSLSWCIREAVIQWLDRLEHYREAR